MFTAVTFITFDASYSVKKSFLFILNIFSFGVIFVYHPVRYTLVHVCVSYICIFTHVLLIQNHLKRLQTAFMNFLAETNGTGFLLYCFTHILLSFLLSRDHSGSCFQGVGFDL